jgi:hypothetical protein
VKGGVGHVRCGGIQVNESPNRTDTTAYQNETNKSINIFIEIFDPLWCIHKESAHF